MAIQIDSLSALKNNSGFWDNFIWPLAVAFITWLVILLRKRIGKKKTKSEIRPTIKLTIDRNKKILLINDKHFETKIKLARQLIRDNKENWISINLIPNYSTKQLDKFAKEELSLKLKIEEEEIKKKIEILLMRQIDIGLEYHADNIKTVLNSLLEGPPFNVTERVKIEIYRTHEPKIDFPIYVSADEFKVIADRQNKTVEEMKRELCIPTLYSVSILSSGIMYTQVIPALVREIYRIHTRHNFDLKVKHWENILGYEVGLG